MKKTQAEIRQIAEWMAAAGLGALELRTPHEWVRLGRGGVPVDARAEAGTAAPDAASRDGRTGGAAVILRAPTLGVLLRRHPGRAEALAEVGMQVSKDQPLALLQIGPLLLAVCAPADGRLLATHAAEGQTVGFGTPLFDFQPR